MFKILSIIIIFSIISHSYCECPKFQEFINLNDTSVIQFVGPLSIKDGRVQGIVDGQVSGSINKVAVHPTNSSIIYIATPNSGIWKTQNALSNAILWKNLTSNLESLSFGSIAFDYSDKTFETLITGTGNPLNKESGLLSGLYITRDGGKTWEGVGKSLEGQNIVGVAMYGNEILACSSHLNQGGIFRSTDAGKNFKRISRYPCTDLISSYSNPGTFFAASLVDGIVEIKAGNSAINKITPSSILENGSIENIKISYQKYGSLEVLYAGLLNSKVETLLRATRDSNNWKWTEFDEPTTEEDEEVYGLHPAELGMYYFSIMADPKNSNLVYLAGDHQPPKSNFEPKWPNSIGAINHVGRIFKVDSVNNNYEPITNINTKSNSAPHAYSKHSVFDANGNLIEVNNGGIYKLKFSDESGNDDWISLNGNLTLTEVLSASYLGNNFYALSTESTGILYGTFNETWYTLTNESTSYIKSDITEDETMMYWSLPYLKDFKVSTFKFSNKSTTITHSPRALLVNGKDYSLNDGTIPLPEHVIYSLNRFSPNKLFFGIYFDGYAYESTDGGRTVNEINIKTDGKGKPIFSVVYGGVKRQEIFDDLVIAVGQDFLAIRESLNVPFRVIESFPPAGIIDSTPVDISVNPTNWEHIAVVFSKGEVTFSKDGGSTWKLINPLNSNSSCFSQKKVVIVPHKQTSTIVVSGQTGVYVYRESKNLWYKLTKWPNVQVNDLQYDYNHDILYVGTLGYGVWELKNASGIFNQEYFKILPAPRPTPNYQKLTWAFAGCTTVLILISIILVIALFRKHQHNYETVE